MVIESKNKIVIARYNENISWAANRYRNRCIIYDKGNNLSCSSDYSLIYRPNRPIYGRESETYLYHIITNYDNLDDYTIFTQADPFKHSPQFLQILDYLDNNGYKNYQPLTCMWKENSEVPPIEYIKYDRTLYVDKYPVYMEWIDDNLCQILYPDYGIMPMIQRFKKIHNIKVQNKILPYISKVLNLENKIKTPYIKFNWGAIFGVHKNNILQHSKEFYENLYKFSIQDWCHGYMLERLWYSIFS